MDKSFFSLSFLTKLYLDSLQMNNVTNGTLEGLRSIQFLQMNSVQFNSIQNINMMIESLSKEYVSRNERYTWYLSTNIEYKLSVTDMDQRYCSMVLYFAKNNILINLLTEIDQTAFLVVCNSFSLSDLEYSKFGFE